MTSGRLSQDTSRRGNGPVDAALFDLDGTLLDTTEAIYRSLIYTVERFTGRTPTIDELRPLMGLPLVDVFGVLTPDNVQEAHAAYVEYNISLHKDYVKPYPGVLDTIRALRRCGVRLAIVTSKRRKTAMIGLENSGLADSFQAIVCYGDTEKAKPDPEPVLLALKLLGFDVPEGLSTGSVEDSSRVPTSAREDSSPNVAAHRREILYVGDSRWDVQAAKNAAAILPHLDIRVAAMTYGATAADVLRAENPDYLFDSILSILPLCRCGG